MPYVAQTPRQARQINCKTPKNKRTLKNECNLKKEPLAVKKSQLESSKKQKPKASERKRGN